jgi:hypothetical protein
MRWVGWLVGWAVPNGLIIKEGGIASGFRKVETKEYKPSLMRCAALVTCRWYSRAPTARGIAEQLLLPT